MEKILRFHQSYYLIFVDNVSRRQLIRFNSILLLSQGIMSEWCVKAGNRGVDGANEAMPEPRMAN